MCAQLALLNAATFVTFGALQGERGLALPAVELDPRVKQLRYARSRCAMGVGFHREAAGLPARASIP
jgi:hypothetical protein